jgi:PAS domain S-box-containing protein
MSEERVRVLLVDDETSVRVPLARYLETNFGYRVDAAADGQGALDLVDDNRGQYDVALIDEVLLLEGALPGKAGADGIRLMQQIKARYPDVEAIIFTGWGRESRQRAIQAGAFRHLEKPFDHDELAMVIRTAAQQVRLRAISRQILSEKDPGRVLQSIMVAACSLALADESAITLWDRASDRLRVYTRTRQAEPLWHRHLKNGNLSRDIVQGGHIVRFGDTHRDERINPRVVEAGIRSFLGLPIPGEEGNLGVLYVYSRRQDWFEEWGTVAVVQTLAGQAGLALANAQVFQEVDRHARYMEALVRAGQGLTRATRLEDQLALAWDFVREQLHTSTFFVALYDGESRTLRFPLAYDEGKRVHVRTKREGEAWGISGYVAGSGEELAWPTAEEGRRRCDELGIEPIHVGKPCQSCIYLPLIVGEEAIGAISIQSYVPHAFAPALLDAFRALGSQLAVALENARLFAELAEANHWRAALIENAFDAVIAIDQEKKITVFNRQAEKMLGWTRDEMIGKTVARLHTDFARARALFEVVRQEGSVADWQVTLKPKEGDPIPARLSATEIRDSRGIAIGQAGFIRDLRQAHLLEDRLRALIEVNQAITETLDPDHVLQLIIESALAAFPAASGGSIHIYDEQTGRLEMRANTFSRSQAVGEPFDFWPGEGIAGRVFQHGRPTVMSDVQKDSRYKSIVHPEAPDHRSMICVPLRVRNRVIGTLSLDNVETTNAFQNRDLGLLSLFAYQAATAIANARLFRQVQDSKASLQSLYEASNALVSAQEPERVMHDIVERVRAAARASWVSVILVDEAGRAQSLVRVGMDEDYDLDNLIRPDGLTMEVVKTGKPVIVEDAEKERGRVNPRMFREHVAAALVLPLSLQGQQIGAMWIHYDHPRHFPVHEVDALQLYVNQASIAYDSARRMRELEYMRKAAEAIAGALEPAQVLQQIVESAQQVLKTDSSAIWSYDDVRDKFIPERSVAVGIPTELWEKFRLEEPQRGRTAYRVMDKDYVSVTDVTDFDQYDFQGDATRQLLGTIGVQSFQGITLRHGSEILGVLYANYNRLRGFSAEDRRILETFANHAALALKKARLLEQVSKARDAAQVVAEVTVLEDLEGTLSSILQGTCDALGCGVVTLYTYDQDRDEIGYPPAMIGVANPEKATRLARIPAGSIVLEMLNRDQPYLVEDTGADPLFKELRFVQDEKIESCAGMPLRVGEHKVGVMFVNYHSRHRFTADELANLELFANQAAVAIRNAQLYQAEQHHVQNLEAIQATSAAVSSVLDLDLLLPMITERATDMFAAPATSLMLWDDRKENLVIRAAVGLGDEYRREQKIEGARVRQLLARTGLVPQIFDIEQRPIGNPELVKKERLCTALVAPLVKSGGLIGILNIYSRDEPRKFDDKEVELARILANHAAIAIQNVQLYDQQSARARTLRILYEAGKVVTSTLTLDEILNRIAQQALKLATPRGQPTHFSHLALVDGRRVRFVAANTPEILEELHRVIGEIDLESSPRIGISGRVVETRASQNVGDTTRDPDYLPLRTSMLSQLAVPITIGEQVIGVINVEHPEYHAFDDDDQEALEHLAAQAAIAIQNARHHEALRAIKGFVGSQTALEWIRMVSTVWGHSIKREVGTALASARLLRNAIARQDPQPALEELEDLKAIVRKIGDIPIMAPLSSEDEVTPVRLNQVIEAYLRHLQGHSRYRPVSITHSLQPDLDDLVTVRASEGWLRRGLEIVVENAAQVMLEADSDPKQLHVTTQLQGNQVQILVRDTGPGIPVELREKLFYEPITKAQGSKGAGIGLLLARTIFETYQGSIEILDCEPPGALVSILLPVESV